MTPRSLFLFSTFAILLLSAAFGGCALGPDYKRPALPLPENYRDAPAATTNSLADLPWWDLYKDETLRGLLRTALENNLDLHVAITRVEQARAVAAQARSLYFPAISYQLDAGHGRNQFEGTAFPNGGKTGNDFLALVNVMWELDLWGRLRRINESEQAQFLATEQGRRAVVLTLVSDVATAYFQLLELDHEREITRRNADSFKDSLTIFRERLENGVASTLETSAAEAALASTAANLPELDRQVALKENQISILLGRPPEAIRRGTTLAQQTIPPEVPAGLPSQLLERRPDVLQAEQLLRSANAQVGVAVTDFFPRLELTSFLGRASTQLNQLGQNPAGSWAVATDLAGPIFQGGFHIAEYQQAVAAWQQTKFQYQQVVLGALQDVSDALISRQKFAETGVEQGRAVVAYRAAVTTALKRYSAGRSSYYEVLQWQQQLFPAEITLARTELNQLLSVVQLYKALGGGWQTEMSPKTSPAPPSAGPVIAHPVPTRGEPIP